MPSLTIDQLKQKESQKYTNLDDDSDIESESATLVDSVKTRQQRKPIWPYVLPWMVSTLVFACLALKFYLKTLPLTSNEFSFETGWKNEIVSARSSIEPQEVLFTGSPAYSENHTYYVPHPDPVNYIGDPSPEVDRNWDELTLRSPWIILTESEAKEAFKEQFGDIQQFWSPLRGGYSAGFSMLHTLYCLNRLRRRLFPEYYPYNNTHGHRTRTMHCVEHIRQYIMCAGDMTPVPIRYDHSLGDGYMVSDVKHTCRNFGKLQEWASERFNGSLAIEPICPKGTFLPVEGALSCILD